MRRSRVEAGSTYNSDEIQSWQFAHICPPMLSHSGDRHDELVLECNGRPYLEEASRPRAPTCTADGEEPNGRIRLRSTHHEPRFTPYILWFGSPAKTGEKSDDNRNKADRRFLIVGLRKELLEPADGKHGKRLEYISLFGFRRTTSSEMAL